MEKVIKFLKDEEGISTLEYALLAAFATVALIAMGTVFWDTLVDKLSNIAGQVSGIGGS